MAKKPEPEKAPNHERWLLTYADMITLLMTFFIVLYALSLVDSNKLARLAESLRTALNVTRSGGTHREIIDMNGQSIPVPASQVADQTDQDPSNASASSPEKLAMSEAEDAINQYIRENGLASDILVELEDKGLVIRLSEAMLFESGQAFIKPSALPNLKKVGFMLNKLNNYVRVEGHTDNLPIHTDRFRSNWQLSAERSTQVTELLAATTKIAPERLSAMGYGQYRPLVPNTTEKGRAKNRRVDIVVLKSKFNSTEEDK